MDDRRPGEAGCAACASENGQPVCTIIYRGESCLEWKRRVFGMMESAEAKWANGELA